jgi:acetyl esterase/lipase
VLPRAVFTPRTLPLARAAFGALTWLTPGKGARIRQPNGQRIYLHRPPTPVATPTPALLWVHGGGTVMGTPEQEARLCREIARRLGIVVAAPGYRLAPQHPWPAALDDLDGALAWLAAEPGIDPARIAVGGDSAGGGLAACLAIHAHGRPGPKPVFQILHEPMLDEATRRRPDPDPAGLRLWSARTNRFGWTAYLSAIDGAVPATASAGRLDDARGLPPAWIGCGTADLFHDEAKAYARQLEADGVRAAFHPVTGAFHGFLTFAPKAEVSRSYLALMLAALAAGLGIDGPEPR